MDKLSKENKTVFLLADFNIARLIEYEQHSPTSELLHSLSFHMFLPHIVQPTRIKNNKKYLIKCDYSHDWQWGVKGTIKNSKGWKQTKRESNSVVNERSWRIKRSQ